jgi:hypothetical protein
VRTSITVLEKNDPALRNKADGGAHREFDRRTDVQR